jgi:hypothetical protein
VFLFVDENVAKGETTLEWKRGCNGRSSYIFVEYQSVAVSIGKS